MKKILPIVFLITLFCGTAHAWQARLVAPALNEAKAEALPYGATVVYVKAILIQKAPGIQGLPEKDEEWVAYLKGKYQERTLSLGDMSALTKEITKKYAPQKARAYVPKQNFLEGVMWINVVGE